MSRSGSTFLGHMLTLSPTSTLVFEPIRSIKYCIWNAQHSFHEISFFLDNRTTDSALDGWTLGDKKAIIPTLNAIFKCQRVGFRNGRKTNKT